MPLVPDCTIFIIHRRKAKINAIRVILSKFHFPAHTLTDALQRRYYNEGTPPRGQKRAINVGKNARESDTMLMQSDKGERAYGIEQMRFLLGRICSVERDDDRAFLALHALHPLRLEEVPGLQWRDVDFRRGIIRVECAATHPGRNQPLVKETKTEASRRTIDLVAQAIPYFRRGAPEDFVVGGPKPLTCTQVRRMCQRIRRDTGFEESVTPRRFRTTVLTDLYDQTKDVKQAQAAAGHTTAAMTLKHYVKGRPQRANTAAPIVRAYGLD